MSTMTLLEGRRLGRLKVPYLTGRPPCFETGVADFVALCPFERCHDTNAPFRVPPAPCITPGTKETVCRISVMDERIVHWH